MLPVVCLCVAMAGCHSEGPAPTDKAFFQDLAQAHAKGDTHGSPRKGRLRLDMSHPPTGGAAETPGAAAGAPAATSQ